MTDQSELIRLREQVAQADVTINIVDAERRKLIEKVEHQTATISAMAETCAKYAKRLVDAEAKTKEAK